MNIDYYIQKLTGKATCVLETQARLLASAKIRNILGNTNNIRIGKRSIIAGELTLFGHGGNISIGEWCYVGENSRIWSSIEIDIKDRVLIAHNVNIFDSLTHPIGASQRHAHFRSIMETGHPRSIALHEKPVIVNNDAWIGANACVLRGVTVGEGAVIGAGSVVTKDVPPYTVVAGNPARVIRELGSDER